MQVSQDSDVNTEAISEAVIEAVEDAFDGNANEEFIEGLLEVVNNG